MALNKTEAVPIDTHVRQIAIRDYNYQMKSKSLTKNAYEELGIMYYHLFYYNSLLKAKCFGVGTFRSESDKLLFGQIFLNILTY